MSGEWDVVDALFERGDITEQEMTDWQSFDMDQWGSVSDFDNVAKVRKLVDSWEDPPDLPPQGGADGVSYPIDDPLAPVSTGLPTALNTTGEEGGDVQVSTNALDTFAGNLKVLRDLVDGEWTSINTVDVRPGTFGAGVHIKTTITDLKDDTMDFLRSVSQTFGDIGSDIKTLKETYESTEEWNEMSVQGLNNTFNDSFGNINDYENFGNSSSENNPGGTGNSDSSGGDKDNGGSSGSGSSSSSDDDDDDDD